MTAIVLVHSDLGIARRLQAVIETQADWRVAGIARDAAGARALLAAGSVDLVVFDLMLSANSLRALLQDVRRDARHGRPLMLALAVSVDDARLMDALRHGADAYFAQTRSPVSLLATIQQTLAGESAMAPQIARQVKAHFDAGAGHLGEADAMLLQWTAEGYLVTEIARGLQLSPRSIGVRIRSIYRMLQFDLLAAARVPMPA